MIRVKHYEIISKFVKVRPRIQGRAQLRRLM